MNIKKILTPKDTEEVKPGLFIQTKFTDDKGIKKPVGYRQIEPVVWNGNYRTKEQLRTVFSFRTLITLAIISFLVWSYLHDVSTYKDFYTRVMQDPIEWCVKVFENTDDELPIIEGINDKENTNTLPSYFK